MSVELTVAGELLKRIAKLGLSSSFEKSLFFSGLSEKTEQQKLKQVSEWYKDESLVLVLGAGASAAYGFLTGTHFSKSYC